MYLKGNYKETFNFLVSKESLLVYFAVLANIVNILMFHESPNLVLLNGLFIIGIYMILSDRKDKIELSMTLFHFSLWGIVIESFLISKTKTLGYANPNKNLNVPLWLLPVYSIFVLGALHTYHIFCIFFNK